MQEILFIYDHTALKGLGDSDFDPTDAIMYFYPPTASLDYQHLLCSHVMGTCQILTNLFKSPPDLFYLDNGAKIACIHEPNNGLISDSPSSDIALSMSTTLSANQRILTFAFYSETSPFNNHIKMRCKLLYESILFYMNKCLFCTFKLSKKRSQSKFITQLVEKLLQLTISKDKIFNIFPLNPFCKLTTSDKNLNEKFQLKVTNFLTDVRVELKKVQITILGGILFHKKQIISSQLPNDISNLLSLIIDSTDRFKETDQYNNQNQMFGPIKKNIVNIDHLKQRQGVYLLKVCLTNDNFNQLLSDDEAAYEVNDDKNYCQCCPKSSCRFVHLYMEHHSETTVIFVIDDCSLVHINENTLKLFSTLCFATLSEIEADIWMEDSIKNDIDNVVKPRINTSPVGSNSSLSTRTSNLIHECKLVYDETNLNLKFTNSNYGTYNSNASANGASNQSKDWTDILQARVISVYEVLKKEPDLQEVHIKFPKETLSAIRNNDEQIYSVKKFN